MKRDDKLTAIFSATLLLKSCIICRKVSLKLRTWIKFAKTNNQGQANIFVPVVHILKFCSYCSHFTFLLLLNWFYLNSLLCLFVSSVCTPIDLLCLRMSNEWQFRSPRQQKKQKSFILAKSHICLQFSIFLLLNFIYMTFAFVQFHLISDLFNIPF